MTKPNTNIHGTAFEGKILVEAIEEQQTHSSRKGAITDALAELKVRSRS